MWTIEGEFGPDFNPEIPMAEVRSKKVTEIVTAPSRLERIQKIAEIEKDQEAFFTENERYILEF